MRRLALVLALLAAAPAVASAAPPVMTEVARETARSGWPHGLTPGEARQSSEVIRRWEAPLFRGSPSRASCVYPLGTVQRFSCAIQSGPLRWSVRVVVRRNGTWGIASRTPVRPVRR